MDNQVYHCLDVDIAGHSAKEAAEVVQKSSNIFIEVLKDVVGEAVNVELAHITGDSGGGAAVHRLHPALVGINVMKEIKVQIAQVKFVIRLILTHEHLSGKQCNTPRSIKLCLIR